MKNTENQQYKVWVKLNELSEIESIIYDYKKSTKWETDIILNLTKNELEKVQNMSIPYQEIFNELNLKYKEKLSENIDKPNHKIKNYISIIIDKINEVMPEFNFSKI